MTNDTTTMRFDPVKLEVLRHAFVEITEEMGLALRRSAYSTNIKTRGDYSCVLFDREARLVAQGFAQPGHLGSMVQIVPAVVAAYGAENLRDGDVLISNHPYIGGVHLNDIVVTTPVYHDGDLFGYVASLAHHVDVGGGAPASLGAFREVFQEGMIIPPVRLAIGGVLNEDVFRLVTAQIRSKHETSGDLRAQLAAGNTGIARLQALVARHGVETVDFYINELYAYSDRRTRAALARLPSGTHYAEGSLDSDGFSGGKVGLCVKVVIENGTIVFDLTGSDPQRNAPVNATYSQTLSAVAYALKCLIDVDIPANDGFYRSIQLIAPAGTVVNCTEPAPVVGGYETAVRLTDIIFKALAPVMPEVVPAGTKAMQCHAGFGGIHPDTGAYYCFLETMGGGYGGRLTKDGPDAVQVHGQNTQNAPIEETERNYPVRILRYELVEDSEGPGRFRGGLGLRRDWQFLRHEATFTVLADREVEGPWGLFGGRAGRPAEYFLVSQGTERRLGSKETFQVGDGDVVSYRTCGGGGYGDPCERDPELVLRDVLEGKVSRERALDEYGVRMDGVAIDADGTNKWRARARAEG